MNPVEARLEPDAARLLAAMRAASPPRLESLSPTAARALIAEMRAKAKIEPPPVAELRDLSMAGPGGPLPLRLYRPAGAGNGGPCIVFLHGGGWVIGNLETHDILCRQIANACGVVLIAVDYRLAPEHRFPAGLDDCCAALRWVAANAADLGVDAGRLVVCGDSAGGNLAAAMALMARDGALPSVRMQALIYPVADLTLGHPSQAMDVDGFVLNGSTMVWFRDHYLGSVDERRDWRASPLFAPSLAGVAPCHIVTAGADPLCDEGVAYAARLIGSGVRVTHEHHPGQMHGFFTGLPNSATLAGALAALAASLRSALNVD